ncbi:MAG: hypothetical protein IT530_05515 [Burkholderiales bacterium]|nr:hypothetical protein [Burkholderiales bacterium]
MTYLERWRAREILFEVGGEAPTKPPKGTSVSSGGALGGTSKSIRTATVHETDDSAPMTAADETAIRGWLARIDETDAAIIAEVLSRCRRDAEARDYFLRRAAVGDADG